MLKWFWNASESWQLENCHKLLLFKLNFFNCFSKYSTWLHSTSNHYFHKSLHIISLQKHCQLHSFWQYKKVTHESPDFGSKKKSLTKVQILGRKKKSLKRHSKIKILPPPPSSSPYFGSSEWRHSIIAPYI